MRNVSCVLFDMYQTLIMKTPTIAQRLDRVLWDLEVPHTPEDAQRMVACRQMQIGLHAQKTGYGMDDERFLAHLLAYDLSRLYPRRAKTLDVARRLTEKTEERYSLLPGAWDVLFQLKRKGVKLGVVCSGASSIRHVLDELALTPFFDCLIISDEAGVQKPDPAIIRLACEQCGAEPKETLFVVGHPFDVLCAHDAGAQAAWLKSNPYFHLPENTLQPEYRLHQLTDLPAII